MLKVGEEGRGGGWKEGEEEGKEGGKGMKDTCGGEGSDCF